MSLQAALKTTREQANKAVAEMRRLGLAVTEAEEKEPGKVAELDEAFKRAQADFTRFQTRVQSLETSLEAEKFISDPVNLPTLDPAEAQRAKETQEAAKKAYSDAAREAFFAYMRFGDSPNYREALSKVSAMERQALVGTEGKLGGFLVPEDWRAELIKNLAGITVMRLAGARTVNCSGSELVYPSLVGGTDPYPSGFEGTWRQQGAQGTDGTAPETQNQPTFGQERIPIHNWEPKAVVLDRSLVEDSAIDLQSELMELISTTRAQDEDYAFIRGTGVGLPRGVMDYVAAATGPAITAVNSGDASLFKYDGLIDLVMTLPIQYRGMASFLCRSTAFGAIMKLKDSSQFPILFNGMPDNIFGKKVWISEHMPAVGSNAYPLLYGAFRYYIIADRREMRVQRLDERFAPNVGFLPTARVGGAVVRTQAFVAQKISA